MHPVLSVHQCMARANGVKNTNVFVRIRCYKPFKPGHYSELRSHILRVLLTLFGEMT